MTIKEVCEKYNITQDTLRYYEKSGMIPPVARTEGGIRNYGEEDLRWIEMALCMRSAGLSVEAMALYLTLFRKGDKTIPERLDLLSEQLEILKEQRLKIDETISLLSYKVERYKKAKKTGKLVWDEKDAEKKNIKKRK